MEEAQGIQIAQVASDSYIIGGETQSRGRKMMCS